MITRIKFPVYFCVAALGGCSLSAKTLREWLRTSGIPEDQQGAQDDYDRDGLPHFLEYALGLSPTKVDRALGPEIGHTQESVTLRFEIPSEVEETSYQLEVSGGLEEWMADGKILTAAENSGMWIVPQELLKRAEFFRIRPYNTSENDPPIFTSIPPTTTEVGQSFLYPATASDEDDDPLTFSLVAGPAGMTMNTKSGLVQWTADISSLGVHSVILRVEDGHNGRTMQAFSLRVTEQILNRPPSFTSDPVVTVTSGASYSYPIAALDPDGDPIVFRLLNGPAGMTLSESTLAWQPGPLDLGSQPVLIEAHDGNGGHVTQQFSVVVSGPPGNRPPLFTSNPPNTFVLPPVGNVASGNVSPASFFVGNNDNYNATASITLPEGLPLSGTADIVITVDQSFSMETEHEWLGEMVTQLESELLNRGIGPNRFALGGFSRRSPHLFNLGAFYTITLFDPSGTAVFEGDFDELVSELKPSLIAKMNGLYTAVLSPMTGTPRLHLDLGINISDPNEIPLNSGFDTIYEGQLAPGKTVSFPLSAASGTVFGFDSLIDGSPRINRDIIDASGTSIGNFPSTSETLHRIPATDHYQATLTNTDTITQPYRFRLISAREFIPLNSRVRRQLAEGLGNRLFFIQSSPGDSLYFRSLASDDNGTYAILDPDLRSIGGQRLDKSTSENIVRPGSHFLLIRGDNADEAVTYDFEISQTMEEGSPSAITFNSPITGSIDRPGQSRHFDLVATAGDLIFYDGLASDPEMRIRIVDPLSEQKLALPAGLLRFDRDHGPIPITSSGIHRITVDSNSAGTGDFAFSLHRLSDALALDFSDPTTTSLPQPHSAKLFSFPASAGDRIFFEQISGTNSPSWQVIQPDGTQAAGESALAHMVLTAEQSGRHTLVISGTASANSIPLTFRARKIPLRAPRALTFGQVTNGTVSPADPQRFIFDGTAGDVLFFDGLGGATQTRAKLTTDDGTELFDFQRLSADRTDPVQLPKTGGYFVTVSNDTQEDSFSFQVLPTSSAPILTPGSPASVSLNPGQTILRRIAANRGQRLTLKSDSVPVGASGVWRFYGSHSQFNRATSIANDINDTNILADGTHLLILSGGTSSPAFEFNFSLLDASDPPVAKAGLDQTITGTLAASATTQVHSFNAPAGTIIFLDNRDGAGSGIRRRILAPSGDAVVNQISSTDVDPVVLPESGTYLVTFENRTAAPLPYSALLSDFANVPVITRSTPVMVTLDTDEARLYSFTASAGEALSLSHNDSTPGGQIRILEPDTSLFSSSGTSDFESLAFDTDGTFILRVSNDGSPATLDLDFQLTLQTETVRTIVYDDVIEDTINSPGDSFAYLFEGQAGDRVNFDGIGTPSSSVRLGTLRGPSQEILERSIILNNDSTAPFTLSETGTHRLEISATDDATGSFKFRLIRAQMPLSLTSQNPLSIPAGDHDLPGTRSLIFTIDAIAGQELTLIPTTDEPADFRVYDSDNKLFELGTLRTNPRQFTFPRTGRHLLRFAGRQTSTTSNPFRASLRELTTQAVTLGENTTAIVATPGATQHFGFFAEAGTAIFYRPLTRTAGTSAAARLHTPSGSELFSLILDRSSGIVTLPESGQYRFSVDPPMNITGNYDFRIMRIDEIPPIDPTNNFTGEFDNEAEVLVFNFEANAGQLITLDRNPSIFGNATDVATATDRLTLNNGATEDGWAGLNVALDLDFLPGAAVNMILVSDEDRDRQVVDLSFDGLLTRLNARNVLLNSVVDASFLDENSNLAVGVDSLARAYLPDGAGNFIRSNGGTFTRGFGLTKGDYVDLAWATGGASWDLKELRDGGLSAQSFTAAFVSIKADEILSQLAAIELVPSDPTAPVNILTGPRPEVTGSPIAFDFEIAPDQTNRNFDLLFIRPNSNTILGSIPVSLRTPLSYRAQARDPDGGPVTLVSLGGGSFDPNSNTLTFSPNAGPGNYAFSLSAKDSRGAETQQNFTVAVSESARNEAPVFVSTAPDRAGINRPFHYLAKAHDTDGDELQFFLERGPEGLEIDRRSGLLSWLPGEEHLGPKLVSIVALDARGERATQAFTLLVNRDLGNQNPVFTSSPPDSRLRFGDPFRYAPTTRDPESDEITLALALGPPGMLLDPTTMLVNWTPLDSQQGRHQVVVRATDPFGGSAFQTFSLTVEGPNSPPLITSTPPTEGYLGLPFTYQPEASDPENDPLSFVLLDAPAGASVSDTNGRISFTPATEGPLTFTLQVSDPFGSSEQEISLQVIDPGPNQSPVFNSSPRTLIALGKKYFYQVVVSDPESQPFNLTLTQAPAGMTLSSNSLLEWTPTGDDFGDNPVTLRANDGLGGITEQSFILKVATTDINLPPTITSTPIVFASLSEGYRYRAMASDSEGDPFVWQLGTAPDGMTVDSTSGLVSFTPVAEQIGEHAVALRALDAQGALAIQSFTLKVLAANLPPVWISQAQTRASQDQLYQYLAQATDPNGDPLSYALTDGPPGAVMTPAGLLSWTPVAAQLGEHTFVITARDGSGGASAKTFTVTVVSTAPASPPLITSHPLFVAIAGQEYRYQVNATDPEGGAVQYGLLDMPAGLLMNSESGLVTWTPDLSQVGPHSVNILATDEASDAAFQAFTITVLSRPGTNRSPIITNRIDRAAAVGQPFTFNLLAFDPDGDPLTYEVANGPESMKINSNGGVSWTPTVADAGTTQITLRVSDPLGALASLNVALPVIEDADGPFVAIDFNENPIDPDTEVTVTVRATDPLGIASLVVTTDGTPVALDANRQFRLTPAKLGSIEIVAKASDPSGNETSVTGTLNVIDTSNVNAPFVRLETPGPGADISAPTEIFATIRDGNLESYEITLEPLEGGDRRILFKGSNPAENELIGTLDPTVFANGAYRLRLRGTDTGGLTGTDEFTVSISGDLKLGDFQVAFEDLNIPLTGTPIVINRIYDSFDAGRSGDFGHGWRLDIAETRLRSTRSLAGQSQDDEVFPAFRPGERVFVTAPGGRRLGFTFEPKINNPFFPIFDPRFIPDPGVTASLTVQRTDLRFDDIRGEFVTYIERLPYNPAAPAFGQFYTLTTAEGIAFRVNAFTGNLETLTDPNGNQLSFSRTGIESSAGTSIDFERDGSGRITAIVDPLGGRIEYEYDAAGDLTSVTDRAQNVTTFTYIENRPHFLRDIIDPLGRAGTRNTYDENGRLITQLNVNGQPTTYTYDPQNAIQTATDSLGRTNVLEFDPRGNLIKITDPTGGVTLQSYDGNDFLSSQTDPLGNVTLFEINEKGFLTSQTDPLGNLSTVSYDNFGNPVTAIDPLGHVTSRNYDEFGNPVSETDAAGNTRTFINDNRGNILSVTDPDGNITSHTYDVMGNRLTTTRRDSDDSVLSTTNRTFDANGNLLGEATTMTTPTGPRVVSRTHEYDPEGQLIRSTDGEGHVSTRSYTASGMIATRTDAKDRTTTFSYNDADKLATVALPDGSTNHYRFDTEQRMTGNIDPSNRSTVLEYDPNNRVSAAVYPDDTPGTEEDNPRIGYEHNAAGRQTAIIDENGNRTRFEYNAAGRRTALIDHSGNTTTFAYDDAGRRISKTDPLGHTTYFVYDALDRLVRTSFPDGTTITRTYDPLGNLASETDQAGRITVYDYDSRHNLVAVTNPAGERTEYEYDELNNRVLQRDALDRITRFEYDGLGQLLATVRPSGARQSHTYDEVGNLTSTTRFGGGMVTYNYDGTDRLINTTYPDGTRVSSVIDDLNLSLAGLVTAPNGDVLSNHLYQLDSRLRITEKTGSSGSRLDYLRDPAGNITSLETAHGTTTFTYNSLNQITSVTDPEGQGTTYSYDDSGNLVRVLHSNGIREVRSYDSLNRLIKVDFQFNNVSISRYDYTLDSSGLRTAVLNLDGTLTEYNYDAAKRLVAEVITRTDGTTQTITYTYDAVGNRIEKNDTLLGLTTYSYNVDDQLTSRTTDGQTTTLTYDGDGNLLSQFTDASNRTDYSWNSRGQLTSLTRIAAGTSSNFSYAYDARGNRTSETINGTTTVFTIDDARPHSQVVEDLDPGGALVARYTVGHNRISQQRNGTTLTYLGDALGSCRALTNSSGTITDQYFYDAFGRLTSSTGTSTNRFLFTGESQSQASGLVHLRARDYDPSVGRFLSTDPFEGVVKQPVSLHRYLYANADPLNVTDPTGKFSLIGINAASGIVINFMKNDISTGSDALFKITRVSNNLLNVGLTQEEMGLLMIIDDIDGGIDIYNAGLEYKIIALEQIHAALSEFNAARLEYLASALDPVIDFINGLPVISHANAIRDFAEGVVSFADSAGALLGDFTVGAALDLIDQGRSTIRKYKEAKKEFE